MTVKGASQQAAFPAAAEAQFADQLFVTGAAAGGTADACEEIAVRGHKAVSMVNRGPEGPAKGCGDTT